MNNKKAVAVAVASIIGSVGTAQAASIVSMTIQDHDGDSVAGGFAFAGPGTTGYTNFFDSTSSVTFTPTFGAPVVVTSASDIIAGAGQGSAIFSAGFLFTGSPFLPASLNGTGTGSNTTTPDGIAGTVVDAATSAAFSQFSWGGQFGPEYFPLAPTGGTFNLNEVSQGTGGGLCPANTNTVCYSLEWDALIAPQGGFSGDTIWALEGVATLDGAVDLVGGGGGSAVPVPAAAWLFGSGLMGLVGVARRRNK